MGERYAISGGSVRDFTWETLEKIKEEKTLALRAVSNVTNDYADDQNALISVDQIDRVRGTYIRDVEDPSHYTNSPFWFQFIDSQHVLDTISTRLPPHWLLSIYEWAKSVGDPVLAGAAFEKYIHCLASHNMLSLYISGYLQRGNRNDPGCLTFADQPLKNGLAMQEGTTSNYEQCLSEWRDAKDFTYWFPACRKFPNIDSIVKCTSSSDQSNVAYLQITVALEHAIDTEQLKRLKAIFKSDNNCERPIYIAVC